KAVKVKWTKQAAKMKTTRISGYQIILATNGNFTKGKKTVNVAGYSKISKKVTGLKGGKRYYVKVRTYKKIGNTKYYSKWSGVKSVKTAN
ncbi:MAG: fibronectin type III domain-containing protein, partial [Firmicutes bacterium]|nr:fibronectin type III domain-containing protein [Bacillota bacterium]